MSGALIDGRTAVYGVIGNPVRHSFSPVLHNAAFRRERLNAVYVAFEPRDAASAASAIRTLGVRGVSVTIPYKESIIAHLDEVTDIAAMIGSVNTVINQNGRLTGTNTDAPGFFRALSGRTDISGKTVAVFGSGGSARAVLFALFNYSDPGRVVLLARNASRREELRKSIVQNGALLKLHKRINLDAAGLSDWKEAASGADILVNTTSVGMEPDTAASVIDPGDMPEKKTVMDIVYRPHWTAFLKSANQKKNRIVFGSEMLLEQGALQFTYWTGREAPVAVMRHALQNVLLGKGIPSLRNVQPVE